MKIKIKLVILCIILVSVIYPDSFKLGFWGSWNIPCGIAVYTKHLSESLMRRNVQVYNYPHTVKLNELINNIKHDGIQILNIQFDPGLMPPMFELLGFMKVIKNLNIKIIVTMHDEPGHAQSLIDSADLSFYHKQPNKAKSPKIVILPMAVPVYQPVFDRNTLRRKYNFKESDKILVSTGFLLETKDVAGTLQHLANYLKYDNKIKIQLLHAFTPRNIPMCTQEYARVLNVIKKFNLHKQVILIKDFIPQTELNERIFLSDLGYQWFTENTNATSATGKEYISARTPLVIPQSNHFHDLFKIKGIMKTPRSQKLFTKKVIEMLNDSDSLKEMRCDLENAYQILNYDNVIKLYYNEIIKLLNK